MYMTSTTVLICVAGRTFCLELSTWLSNWICSFLIWCCFYISWI